MEEISFEAADKPGGSFTVDAEHVSFFFPPTWLYLSYWSYGYMVAVADLLFKDLLIFVKHSFGFGCFRKGGSCFSVSLCRIVVVNRLVVTVVPSYAALCFQVRAKVGDLLQRSDLSRYIL